VSALKPGLYRATVRGIPGESIVMVGKDGYTYSLAPDGEARACYVFQDARPLIVLDLDYIRFKSYGLRDVIGILRRDGHEDIADQIEAQTKPARIPEPGLWGVVDSDGVEFVHRPGGWQCPVGGWYSWDRLINPALIRDGIEATS
jgi:hypothetical protein